MYTHFHIYTKAKKKTKHFSAEASHKPKYLSLLWRKEGRKHQQRSSLMKSSERLFVCPPRNVVWVTITDWGFWRLCWWMDGWGVGRTDEKGWMDDWMVRWMNGWMVDRIFGQVEEELDRWVDELIGRLMGGMVIGWGSDEWIEQMVDS